MTGMPEAALARELGIPYAAINVVANFAAGRAASASGICFDSIDTVLREAMGRVRTCSTTSAKHDPRCVADGRSCASCGALPR
jgi:purine nucleoside phosphorylase